MAMLRPRSPISSCAAMLLLVAGASGQMGMPPKPSAGEREEVPSLLCDVCISSVEASFNEVQSRRANAVANRLGEDEINGVIERLCDPKNVVGHHLRKLDIYADERRSRTLLKTTKKEEVGKCGVECETLAMACDKLMDEIIDVEELVVALYKAKKDANQLVDEFCKEAEPCEGGPKALPQGYKRADHPFEPMDEADLNMESMMAEMNAMGMGGNFMTADDMEGYGGDMDGYDFGDMDPYGDMDPSEFGGADGYADGYGNDPYFEGL